MRQKANNQATVGGSRQESCGDGTAVRSGCGG